jgi:hypothetical protein
VPMSAGVRKGPDSRVSAPPCAHCHHTGKLDSQASELRLTKRSNPSFPSKTAIKRNAAHLQAPLGCFLTLLVVSATFSRSSPSRSALAHCRTAVRNASPAAELLHPARWPPATAGNFARQRAAPRAPARRARGEHPAPPGARGSHGAGTQDDQGKLAPAAIVATPSACRQGGQEEPTARGRALAGGWCPLADTEQGCSAEC